MVPRSRGHPSYVANTIGFSILIYPSEMAAEVVTLLEWDHCSWIYCTLSKLFDGHIVTDLHYKYPVIQQHTMFMSGSSRKIMYSMINILVKYSVHWKYYCDKLAL